MKTYKQIGFTAFLLVLFFGTCAVTESNAQNIKNEILKRMDEHNKALTSLRANVVMDKYNSQLDEHDATEGKAIYLTQKGGNPYVRIDWTKPVEESLAVVNKQYILFRPRLKQAIIGSTDQAQGSGKAGNALSFINMSKEQLQANYTVKYLGQEKVKDGTLTWHLELTPKTAQSYKSAELWVDGNGMPIQAKIIEQNSDATTVFLSNLEKNKTINASQFKISPPKGTSIVKG